MASTTMVDPMTVVGGLTVRVFEVTDFAAYFIGGWVAGRQGPLYVYGPSGTRPELGTKYAIEHWEKALSWDVEGRAGRLPASGGKVIVHEFDFAAENYFAVM